MDVFDAFSWLGSGLFTIALMPQFVRTWRRGHADDISIWFLVTVIAASLASGIWAVSLPNYVVAGGFAANLLVWGYVLVVRLRPRVPERAG